MGCTCRTSTSFLFSDKYLPFELKLFIVQLNMQTNCINCNKRINHSPCEIHNLCHNCLLCDPIYRHCFV